MPNLWLMNGGTKAIDVAQFFAEVESGETSGNKRPEQVYGLVPWIYRCVELRAQGVARLTFSLYQGKGKAERDDPTGIDWLRIWHDTEAARCVFGAAYWLKTRTIGQTMGLRWLNPLTMTVKTDPRRGIVGFEQRVHVDGQERQQVFQPNQVVYCKLWNPTNDLYAGISPTQVALTAARVAINANEHLERFFKNSGIPAVLLTTDQEIPDVEVERIRTVWERLYSGVKNAWRTAILKRGLKPTVVGSLAKDLAVPELMAELRREIAVAFGIPVALLEDAANRATAREQMVAYYTETIFPQAEAIQAVFNGQFWGDMGLRMEFRFGDVEQIQQDEATKAIALVQMVNARIMTRNEARRQINLDEIPGLDDDFAQSKESGPSLAEQASVPEPTGTPMNQQNEQELRRWRNRAQQGDKKPPDTKALPQGLQEMVQFLMLFRPAAKAFSWMDPFEDWCKTLEDETTAKIEAIFTDQLGEIARSIRRGEEPNLDSLEHELRRFLLWMFLGAFLDEVMRLSNEIGIPVAMIDFHVEARDYALARLQEVIPQLMGTTSQVVETALSWVRSLETAPSLEEISKHLEAAFDRDRALKIATTEITTAASAGAEAYRRFLESMGLVVVEFWETAKDERVCILCGPLDGETEAIWRAQFPKGPPAHIHCRCRLRLMVMRPKK